MRPIEILLTLVILAAFPALAFPRLRMVGAARFLHITAMLASGAQILLEDARWQMAPAYAVSMLLLIVSLCNLPLQSSGMVSTSRLKTSGG